MSKSDTLRELIQRYAAGDEQPLIDLLSESIQQGGPFAEQRARWLEVDGSLLRQALRIEGLIEKYPHVVSLPRDWRTMQRLVRAYRAGDEAPLIRVLNDSINEAGPFQFYRARWLNISDRTLRRILAQDGLLEKYPHVRGAWPGESG